MDAALVNREVGAGQAVDADVGDGLAVSVDAEAPAGRADRGVERVTGADPIESEMGRQGDTLRADQVAVPAYQHDVRL